MSTIRSSLFLLICCSLCRLGADELVVSAKVIEAGLSRDGRQACIVQAEVRNQSAGVVSVAMMSCGWDESWRVEPKQVVAIMGWDCSKNIPKEYLFPVSGGFSFRFCVEGTSAGEKIEGRKFKIGFVVVEWTADPFLMHKRLKAARAHVHRPVIWSDELVVPKINDQFVDLPEERKELPTQH